MGNECDPTGQRFYVPHFLEKQNESRKELASPVYPLLGRFPLQYAARSLQFAPPTSIPFTSTVCFSLSVAPPGHSASLLGFDICAGHGVVTWRLGAARIVVHTRRCRLGELLVVQANRTICSPACHFMNGYVNAARGAGPERVKVDGKCGRRKEGCVR